MEDERCWTNMLRKNLVRSERNVSPTCNDDHFHLPTATATTCALLLALHRLSNELLLALPPTTHTAPAGPRTSNDTLLAPLPPTMHQSINQSINQ